MVYYSALHWAKKAEKSAEKCEQIQEDLDASGLDLSKYAKKGEVVHNTGDETIDGVKTFNSNVNFNNTVSFVKNTTNTQDTYQDINFIRDNALETNNIPYDKTYYTNALMDKNNKYVTYIQNTHKADGMSTISISARTQNANGENVTSSIIVSAEKNGNVSATAPVPTASSSMDSKQISTVGWVNDPTKSTNVLHRTGDESFSGTKTMLGQRFIFGATNLGSFKEIEARSEKGSMRLGVLRFQNGSDGITRSVEMSVVDNTNSNRGGIKVGVDSNGNMYTNAPHPKENSNDAAIATTGWVVKHQPAITTLSATSGNISLSINNIYTMSVSGTTTFSLATPSNKSVFNQIKLMMKVTGTPTINWGTTYFFNKIEPRIEAGSYDVYFDYDNLLSAWVCGVIPKGTKEY